MKIRITNRSKWPTPFLRVLARWIAKREGLGCDTPYTFVFRSSKNHRGWRGLGGAHYQVITLHRHFQPRKAWPMTVKDHRFKWSTAEVYNSRLEVLVGLMAHEAHHATGGQPSRFYKNGRIDNAAM